MNQKSFVRKNSAPSKILIIIPAYNEEHIIKKVSELHTHNPCWNLQMLML